MSPRAGARSTAITEARNARSRTSTTGLLLAVLAVSLTAALLASAATAFSVLPPPVSSPPGGVSPVVVPAISSPVAMPGSPNPAPVGADRSTVIEGVAARAGPAVVTITNSGGGGSPFGPAAVGTGSGFVLRQDGYILTNAHVVEGATSLTVRFSDTRELPATIVQSDPAADLAVIKVDATGLPTLRIGSSTSLRVGQLVIAVGSPLGTFSDSVTVGIVSGLGRSITVQDPQTGRPRRLSNLLQTDAAINPGNSGGPLLNGAGQVIGINTATDPSSNDLGFAIPIDEAQSIIAAAIGR